MIFLWSHDLEKATSISVWWSVRFTSRVAYRSHVLKNVRLLPKDLSLEHGGAKLASCPRRHLTSLHPWASAEIFPGGGATSTFRLSFFRLRTMQHKWTFTKRLTFLHTEDSNLRKGTFWHPLQLLLNLGITQYHYYCQLQTTVSELDLNYPPPRLRCSH